MLLEHDINKLLLDADLGKYETNTNQHNIHYIDSNSSPASLSNIPGLGIQSYSKDSNLRTQYTFQHSSLPESTCLPFSTLSNPQVQHFSDNYNLYTFPQTSTSGFTSTPKFQLNIPELHFQSTSEM